MSGNAALKRDRYRLRFEILRHILISIFNIYIFKIYIKILLFGVTLFLNNPKGSRCAVLHCYGIH